MRNYIFVVYMFSSSFLMRNIEVSIYVWVYDKYCIYALPWNSPWTWLLCMIGVDFFFYWAHRCSHGMPNYSVLIYLFAITVSAFVV